MSQAEGDQHAQPHDNEGEEQVRPHQAGKMVLSKASWPAPTHSHTLGQVDAQSVIALFEQCMEEEPVAWPMVHKCGMKVLRALLGHNCTCC